MLKTATASRTKIRPQADSAVESKLSHSRILRQNPQSICPAEILEQITVIEVDYYSFDGNIYTGQIAIHKDLAADVQGAFELLLSEEFPIESVIPIADRRFGWNDSVSTSANNTSAYNYRYVRGTNDLSNHATGRAIDINPRLNPYLLGGKTFPSNGFYDKGTAGTILENSKLVRYFEALGWRWGGNWDEDLDFQHFEKP